MFKNIKIHHTILFLFILTILFSFDNIYGSLKLLIYFISELFFAPFDAVKKIDLLTIDHFISIILFCSIPLILIKFRSKSKILNSKIELSSLVFIFIFYATIFAPLVTTYHPNAQTDIRATRFLPPFSSILIIKLNEDISLESNFDNWKNRFVKDETISNKIFVNLSRMNSDTLFFREDGLNKSITRDELISTDKQNNIASTIYFLGTDELGRDIFSRLIYGARVSLFIAFLTVAISLLVAVFLGFIAAYHRGALNLIFSRITDMFLTIPSIIFVIMILALWGNSIFTVIMVLGLTGWMSIFKVVKGEVASIIEKDYFVTSRKIGLSYWSLLFKEIFPVLIISLTVAIVFQFSNVILAESSLSYLGLGVGINYPSWGNMISSGQKYMTTAWWLLIIPSLALVIVLLSINSFGEKIKKIINPTIIDD